MASKAKIVLQHRESRLYLQAVEKWTADLAQAVAFEHVTDASAFARKHKAGSLDIVMCFGDPQYDVRLPAAQANE